MERTPEQLARLVRRKESARTCENIMGRYCFYQAACRFDDILAMWADDPDTRIELPWGVYDGKEGVARYFAEERPAHDDLNARKGYLDLQALNGRMMEVAEDNQTARAIWFTIGSLTEVKNGEPNCQWHWVKFAVDFKKESGVWKIWHLTIAPIFKTDFEVCWTEQEKLTLEKLNETPHSNDRKPTARKLWSYHLDNVYPLGQPSLPKPYSNFDIDVGYGY
jgi:hypothetical protein